MTKAVYVHIPFCAHLCTYCDFARCGYHEGLADQYLKALKQQIDTLTGPYETFYIGGGTPTALSASQLERLFQYLNPYLESCKEVTIEVNPETMTAEKYAVLEKTKVNRVSIGAQSTDPQTLIEMNRQNSFSDIVDSIEAFRQINITNYSLDLIYGWPHQTLEQLKNDLERLVALDPTHLSIYSLIIEPNSELGRKNIQPVSVELETEMYEHIVRFMKEKHYRHYEVANFCKPGFESLHNQVYWRYEDFVGIGLGASGKQGGQRYTNTSKFVQYLENPFKREEQLDLELSEQYFEYLMMNLRTDSGINFTNFKERYQKEFTEVFDLHAPNIKEFLKQGLLEWQPQQLKATELGRMVLNDMLLEFME